MIKQKTAFLNTGKTFILIIQLILSLIMVNVNACSYNHPIQGGQIADTVRCKTHPEFSYALYLPENYSESLRWPIIFIFDPGARGKIALTQFVKAADKYGYILAASNNSRNGIAGDELIKIINSLFEDTEMNLSIDSKRIYTTGFSGGSRVASLIALQNKNIAGVIGCGAGLPNYQADNQNMRFDYFGLVGDLDMNYLEMIDLDKKLKEAGTYSHLKIFEGNHVWPSPDLISEAIEWMELRAIQKGIKDYDSSFMKLMFEKKNDECSRLLDSGNTLQSVQCMNEMLILFNDTPSYHRIKNCSDSIQNTKSYQKEIKKKNEAQKEEQQLQRFLFSEMRNIASFQELPDTILEKWMVNINNLKKTATGSNMYNKKMAARMLNYLSISCFEAGKTYLRNQQYNIAVSYYLIASKIEPNNNNTYFLLAKSYALNHDFKNALRYLEKAVEKGYNNRSIIMNEPAFKSLLNEPEFIGLMETLEGSPRP